MRQQRRGQSVGRIRTWLGSDDRSDPPGSGDQGEARKRPRRSRLARASQTNLRLLDGSDRNNVEASPVKRFRLLRTSPLSGPLTLAGPVARADNVSSRFLSLRRWWRPRTAATAPPLQYAAQGLVLPIPAGNLGARGRRATVTGAAPDHGERDDADLPASMGFFSSARHNR